MDLCWNHVDVDCICRLFMEKCKSKKNFYKNVCSYRQSKYSQMVFRFNMCTCMVLYSYPASLDNLEHLHLNLWICVNLTLYNDHDPLCLDNKLFSSDIIVTNYRVWSEGGMWGQCPLPLSVYFLYVNALVVVIIEIFLTI